MKSLNLRSTSRLFVLVICLFILAVLPMASTVAHAGGNTVLAWGLNDYGQLGNGGVSNPNPTPTAIPAFPPAGTTVTALAAGGHHSVAVLSNGQLWSWGNNTDGEEGQGTVTIDIPNPVKVMGFSNIIITAVATGQSHTLALTSTGAIYAWGYGGNGEIGFVPTNSCTCADLPVLLPLPGGVTATAVAAGNDFSLALGSNGIVYAWGSNSEDQLGFGPPSDVNPTPTAVAGLANVTAIAAGNAFSLALKPPYVYAWGQGSSGQLGNGVFVNHRPIPRKVHLSHLVPTAIAAGGSHGMVRVNTGAVYTWGDNTFGQLGNNSTVNSNVPVLAIGINASAIAAGMVHSLALQTGTGSVWGWGDSSDGQQGVIGPPVLSPAAIPPGLTASVLGIGCQSYHILVS